LLDVLRVLFTQRVQEVLDTLHHTQARFRPKRVFVLVLVILPVNLALMCNTRRRARPESRFLQCLRPGTDRYNGRHTQGN
jgi:hypothetical protein